MINHQIFNIHLILLKHEKYTKFEESELIKDFPIEACRLDGEGQDLRGSHSIGYNYGKA